MIAIDTEIKLSDEEIEKATTAKEDIVKIAELLQETAEKLVNVSGDLLRPNLIAIQGRPLVLTILALRAYGDIYEEEEAKDHAKLLESFCDKFIRKVQSIA